MARPASDSDTGSLRLVLDALGDGLLGSSRLVLSVVYLYYTIVGPLQALNQGEWFDRRRFALRIWGRLGWGGCGIRELSGGFWVVASAIATAKVSAGFDPARPGA